MKLLAVVLGGLLLAPTYASANLMKEPSGALKGKRHEKYSSIHVGITDCEQIYDRKPQLKVFPIKLRKYNFKDQFYSPYANLGGASCKAGFTQRFDGEIDIDTKLPPLIDAKGGGSYGHRNNARNVAMAWWSVATSHAAYNPNSRASKVAKITLMNWASNNALSVNILASYGKNPIEYEIAVMVSRIVETVGALGPEMTVHERAIVGPWLDNLVRTLQKSRWVGRQDNKQYLKDYTVALWGVINNDKGSIAQLARNYKHAIHDMRDDGSIVRESVRGGTTLHYQALAAQLLVKQAALIKNVTGVDISKYEAEGNRSLKDALSNMISNYRNPRQRSRIYGRSCPGSSFGSLANPAMNWSRFALKPVLEYVNFEHKDFSLGFSASQVSGSTEYHTTGNIKCMYTE